MKYCKNCLTTSLRPNSSFNKDGVCISCEYSLKISSDKTHTHLVKLKEKITSLRKEAKMKLNNYDCMVGVSGGKDSTRQALWVRDRLKMNPLLVCCAYPPYQMTDIGAKNLDNLVYIKDFFDWLGVSESGYKWFVQHRLSSVKHLISEKPVVSKNNNDLPFAIKKLVRGSKRAKSHFKNLLREFLYKCVQLILIIMVNFLLFRAQEIQGKYY